MYEDKPFPEDEIITFYDRSGRAVFYLNSDGEYFYHYDGTPLGYLYDDEYVLSFTGNYLGWIHNGSIIDFNSGGVAFFTEYSSGGPTRPTRKTRPTRGTRKTRPTKSTRKTRPTKPTRKTSWSGNSDSTFFPDYNG